MSLIDQSPGGFFAVVNLVVYGFIALEVVMILTGSMTGVALVLALVVATALMILRFMEHLLSDQTGEGVPPRAQSSSTGITTPASRPTSTPRVTIPAP
jgi:hypothetical protein